MAAEGGALAPVLGPLLEALHRRHFTIAVAESCTGGLLSAALTELPGSSEYFLGGMVTYANEAKMAVLGVDAATLRAHGAVSAEVAEAMARGVLKLFNSDIAVSVTGIAGPDAEGDKPVGLTFIGVAGPAGVTVRQFNWAGGRAANRAASVEAALQMAAEISL